MGIMLPVGVCLIALYAVDAWFCDGAQFNVAREMAEHWRQNF